MKPRRTVIIKAGTKPAVAAAQAGDYEDWICAGAGWPRAETQVVAVVEGDPLPPLAEVAAIAITGSAAMVTERAPWMVATEAWLRAAVRQEIPVLGICFGHQLLAQALGGRVDYNPRGVEVGTTTVTLSAEAAADPLFAGLPARFPAQTSHRQTVITLPPGARLLATSALDGHQAFRVGELAWGVQFHPEFEAAVMGGYIGQFRPLLAQEGKDADAIAAAVAATPAAGALLGRFAMQVRISGEKRRRGGHGAFD